MARLAVFSFAVAFLIFTFVTAIPDEYISTIEPVTELSESNPKTTNTILHPSEKSESEPVDFKPDDALEPKSDVESVPMSTIHLRPANRQFPLRPFIPFRHKQDCRFHRKVRPFNPRHMQNIYIPYGNDMLPSNGRISFDPESQGFVHPIHARWVTFQDDTDRSKEVVDIIKLHHHDHEYNHDDHENDDDHDDHDDHNDHDDHDNHNDHDDHDHEHEHDHDHEHDHHDDHEHDRDHDDQEHEHGHHDDREHDRYHDDGREHDHDEDHHHRHRHHHHHHHHEKEDDMEEHEHKGGFMRKLGKFPLIHF